MYKKLLYATLCFLMTGFGLTAEEDKNQVLNVIYLIPESPCDWVTHGKSYCLNAAHLSEYGYRKEPNSVRLSYNYEGVDFDFDFAAPKGQVLIPGIYQNAERMPSRPYIAQLDIDGLGRGNNSSLGEFEVYEIEYDENGKLASFAVDFHLYDMFKGAIRFNSNYPVNEYFIKMTDPSTNWKSQHLLYVRMRNFDSNQYEKFLAVDRRELSVLVEKWKLV